MSRSEDDRKKMERAALAGAAQETVQRYGSASKEHLTAYSGIDNELRDPVTGEARHLQKSLKSIHNQGSNDEYAFSIRQQKAGWAAEVKDTAETNAEKIIAGDKTRKIRHDDLPDTPANHPLYDHVEIDAEGNVICSSGTQMKFIGASENDPSGAGNAGRALDKLCSKKFEKYIDKDVKIEVPKDEYQQMADKAGERIEELQKQLARVEASGNKEAAAKIRREIEKLEKLKKLLRPSELTRKQSLEAVDSPEMSTAKSIAKISHRAGVEQAKIGAAISGAASLLRNFVAVVKEEKTAGEAAEDIVMDTGTGAVVSYFSAFAGSALKGAMQNAPSEYVRSLAKTNLL